MTDKVTSKSSKYKYSLIFSSTIKPVISQEYDKYLSKASLEQLRPFIPQIDLDKNIDLLPFSANCFVANRLNKNFDGVRTEEALTLADTFKLKFLNLEHNRTDLKGVILESYFSEFGSDKPLTREEVKDYKKPFNVLVGGVIWRVVDPEFANFIEESNNPSSSHYLEASLSWEVMFSEFGLVMLDSDRNNFEDGELIIDPNKVKELEGKLLALGGTGKVGDKKLGRVPLNNIIAAGAGVTSSPAADVKGIAVQKIEESKASEPIDNKQDIKANFLSESLIKKLKDTPESGMGYHITDIILQDDSILENIIISNCSILPDTIDSNKIKNIVIKEIKANSSKNIKKSDNSISHNDKSPVNQNIENNIMIKNIKELTDENLKEIKAASDITSLYDTDIKKINDEWVKKVEAEKNSAKAANDKVEEITKSQKDIQEKLDKITENYNKLVEANKQKEQVEVFSARMTTLENEFDLNQEEKDILAEDVKLCENDEAFAKFMKKNNFFLKFKKKGKPGDKETKKEDKEEKKEESKASVEDSQKVVDDAIKNGEKEKVAIANAGEAKEETLADKATKAFGLEGWTTENKRKNRNNKE